VVDNDSRSIKGERRTPEGQEILYIEGLLEKLDSRGLGWNRSLAPTGL
jgi:hypothetical protein